MLLLSVLLTSLWMQAYAGCSQAQDGYFTIISPGNIHPNTDYSVLVSIQGTTRGCRVELRIRNKEEGDDIAGQVVRVKPKSAIKVNLKIANIPYGQYMLLARGTGALCFNRSKALIYADNPPAIYIQTDKGIYKPGDWLRFRAVFLDENIRPATVAETVTLYIKDANNNRLADFSNITLANGVFSDKWQINSMPVLGEWSLEVRLNDILMEFKKFEVQNYVLPRFEVTIEAPAEISILDPVFIFSVRSSYTYGRSVKGSLTVKIFKDEASDQPIISRTDSRNGVNTFEFDVLRIVPKLNVFQDPETIYIEAVMEEQLTGKQESAAMLISVVKNRFHMWAPKLQMDCSKQLENYLYTLTIKDLEHRPITDRIRPVTFTTLQGEQIRAFLNATGMVTIALDCSKRANFPYVAEYQGQRAHISIKIKKEKRSPGIYVRTAHPHLRAPIDIEFIASEEIEYFVYVLVGHGNIIKSERLEMDGESKSAKTFRFNTTIEMVPETNIYVHYIKDGNYKFIESSFKMRKEFWNRISITAPAESEPGNEILLRVQTEPHSFVGLMAIDQNVLLLRGNNDFEADKIIAHLEKITTEIRIPSKDTSDIYPGEETGVITLTNAYFPYEAEPLPKDDSDDKAEPETRSIFITNSRRPLKRTKRPPLSKLRIREQFMETWLFEDIERSFGNATLLRKVPDTMTSWVVSGFSLHKKKGFALTQDHTKVLSFKPFFINTDLPYSIKRGEIVSIPVIVYNYLKMKVRARVSLSNDGDNFSLEGSSRQTIDIESNSGETVVFNISANHIGYIDLNIKAECVLAGDAIRKVLKVESEGRTVFRNHGFLLHKPPSNELSIDSRELILSIPANSIVSDSVHIEVLVTGDILGTTFTNLDKLVRKPTGHGEENMIRFVPNILVLRYLMRSPESNTEVESQARRHLRDGYRNQLSYKNDNGSYAIQYNSTGSTWLTAYVMRYFLQAKRVHPLLKPDEHLKPGFDFLRSRQTVHGNFTEYGTVEVFAHLHGVGLTAFVLLAFLEDSDIAQNYTPVIERGFNYLSAHINSTSDMFALAIAAYALQQHRNHELTHHIIERLQHEVHTDGGHMWWTQSGQERRSGSHDVEVTAYILMTLLEMNTAERPAIIAVTKWLVSQRNSNGGFNTSHETVVALQALIKFAEVYRDEQHMHNITIDIISNGDFVQKFVKKFIVSGDNALMTQTIKLDEDTRKIRFNTYGQGLALLQISYRYNTVEMQQDPSFDLSMVQVEQDSDKYLKYLQFCVLFQAQPGEREEINTAILEINMPSGFIITERSMLAIKSIDDVESVEAFKSYSVVVVYFKRLKSLVRKCITAEIFMIQKVEDRRNSTANVYDFDDCQKITHLSYHI